MAITKEILETVFKWKRTYSDGSEKMPTIQDLGRELHIYTYKYYLEKANAMVKKEAQALALCSKVMQLVTKMIQEY
jgi:hypothetical protein